jgi:hypothetical protein
LILAHNCAVQGIHADTGRLLSEPWGDYHVGLSIVSGLVSETNRQAEARARAEAGRS